MVEICNLHDNDSLEVLVRRIEEKANAADEHVIEAAKLIAQARARIGAGEEGEGVKWAEWALKNIRLSPSRLYELQTIGEAQDPAAELERLRHLNRERQKDFRDRNSKKPVVTPPQTEAGSNSEPKTQHAPDRKSEPERAELIAWAKSAPLDEVRRILAMTKNVHIPQPANDDVSSAA